MGSLFCSSVPAAGNAFCQAAQLHLQLQSKHDAATCFVDAGNAFKKADPQGEGPWDWPSRAPAEPSGESPPVSQRLRFPPEAADRTRCRLAGRHRCFNLRIGSLPVAICIIVLQASPPPPTLRAADAPSPAGSIWEWELHSSPTACQGEKEICSLVRINLHRSGRGSEAGQVGVPACRKKERKLS